jgi:hypothetical protein
MWDYRQRISHYKGINMGGPGSSGNEGNNDLLKSICGKKYRGETHGHSVRCPLVDSGRKEAARDTKARVAKYGVSEWTDSIHSADSQLGIASM